MPAATAAERQAYRSLTSPNASEMLGHATIAVTLDLYSQVSATMQRSAADEIDSVLEAVK